MGEKTSSIEMDAADMTSDQLMELEIAVNERIRAACKMFPTLYESKDDPELLDVSDHLHTYSSHTHTHTHARARMRTRTHAHTHTRV